MSRAHHLMFLCPRSDSILLISVQIRYACPGFPLCISTLCSIGIANFKSQEGKKKKFNLLYTAKVVSGYGRLVSTLFKVCPIARIYPIKELLDQTSHQPLFLSSVLVIRMGKGVDSIHRVGSIS